MGGVGGTAGGGGSSDLKKGLLKLGLVAGAVALIAGFTKML